MMTLSPSFEDLDMHYCTIFTDCYHCPAPVCPYEKDNEDGYGNGYDDEDEDDDDEDWG